MTSPVGSSRTEVLRVPATDDDIKKSYGSISRLYGSLEAVFEKGVRQKALEFLSVVPAEEVLEIGIGTGFSLVEIARAVGKKGKAYGLDISPQMLEMSRKRVEKAGLGNRIELVEADARNMPYEDNKFDAVYLASTLELFDTPDIPRALGEIKRVLKHQGRLAVASMTREGREGSRFIKLYEWLHQRFPRYASCRPIYVEESVAEAGYEIMKTEEYVLFGMVPWRIVVARPMVSS